MKKNAFIIALTILTGCSITQLQNKELISPDQLRSGDVNIRSLATGFSGGRVGFGRLSLLYIPVAPVRIESNEANDLMNTIRDALIVSGYDVSVTDDLEASPVLKAHVNEVKFNNYTWAAPLIPTFGSIDVTLTLESEEGLVLWEKGFSGGGTSWNLFNGFNVAAREVMTRLGNEMVNSFSGPDFFLALEKEISQPPAEL